MAWIYHNATLWVISLSSDGENWITIADKNLGATTVYNNGDTLSEANSGKYYQWGNNYWFPFTWSVTTSSTQVNASNYWPWNYYSSSTFITTNWWDSSRNTNLRWWVTWTYEAMQWPCDEWFHVPSLSELTTIYNIWITLWCWNSSSGNWLKTYLKMPIWWVRSWTSVTNKWELWRYWTSYVPSWDYYARVRDIWLYTNNINYSYSISDWNQIRPFKNGAVIPDYNDVWDTLYWDELPDRPIIPIPQLKYLYNWWNYFYFDEPPIHVNSISLNESEIVLTEVGQTYQLTATVTPSDAVDKSIVWTSSDTSIATVNPSWLVTCVEPGDCTITATTNDWGLTASCSVITIHVTWITLDKNSIALNTAWQTEQLVATITPSDAANKNIIWTSSDETIATVSQTWLVTCVTPGSCTITATTEDWWYTATCSVVLWYPAQVDMLLVWWWGWWHYNWWWGWWEVICTSWTLTWWACIKIWWWWGVASNWWTSCIIPLSWTTYCARWWCAWKICQLYWERQWWWNSWNWCIWWNWMTYGSWDNFCYLWWWGAWAWWNWWKYSWVSWWGWWTWIQVSFWDTKYYWWWWGWGWCWWSWAWWNWWGWRWAKWCAYSTYNATSWTDWLWWWGGWWSAWWCVSLWNCPWWKWVVIIRYPSSCWYNAEWWCKYLCWDYCYHCFTSNWEISFN